MTKLQALQAGEVTRLSDEVARELPLAFERWGELAPSGQIRKLGALLRLLEGRVAKRRKRRRS